MLVLEASVSVAIEVQLVRAFHDSLYGKRISQRSDFVPKVN